MPPLAANAFAATPRRPAHCRLDGSAVVAGDVFQLTTGEPNQVGSLFYDRPVDLSVAFTATCQFRMVGEDVRYGLLFGLQNGVGALADSAVYKGGGSPDLLGAQEAHFVVAPCRVDAGASTYGLHLVSRVPFGRYRPTDPPEVSTPIGEMPIDDPGFASGRWFDLTLEYDPDASTMGLTLGDAALGFEWSLGYSGIPDLESLFVLDDAPGNLVYLGLTAVTGGGDATIEVSEFTWSSDGATVAEPHATARLTMPDGEGQRAWVAAYSEPGEDGIPLRRLAGALALPGGEEYDFDCDGKDETGEDLPVGYEFRAGIDTATADATLVGNSTALPPDNKTSFFSVHEYGVAIAPDGTGLYAFGALEDTGAQGGILPLNPATGAVLGNVATLGAYTDWGLHGAVDDTYLYYLYFDYGGSYRVARCRRSDSVWVGFPATLDNDDDTSVETDDFAGPSLSLVLSHGTIPRPEEVGTDILSVKTAAFTRIAIAATSFWVCSPYHDLVYEYVKGTGAQVGTPIAVEHAVAIAVLGNGNIAVAHGATEGATAATTVSVYNPSTHALIGTMAGLPSFGNIVDMSFANGLLLVVDDGNKEAKVFAITGNAATGLIDTICRPASFGDDDGIDTIWTFRAGVIDNAGNKYLADQPIGSFFKSRGAQLIKRNAAGAVQWRDYGHSCTSTGVMVSDTLAMTTAGKWIGIDLETGVGDYLGSFAYRGMAVWGDDEANRYTVFGEGHCLAPPNTAILGGNLFVGMPVQGDGKLIILRVDPDARTAIPAAVVWFRDDIGGRFLTWHNEAGDGYPTDEQVVYSGPVKSYFAAAMQLAADGSIYITISGGTVLWLAPPTLSGQGNPIYGDYASLVEIAGAASSGFGTEHNAFLAVGAEEDNRLYLLTDDIEIAPYTARTANGDNTAGGCRAVTILTRDGSHVRTIPIHETSAAIVAYPGGFVIGGYFTSRFMRYDLDGNELGWWLPAHLNDFLDFPGGPFTIRLVGELIVVFAEAIAVAAYSLVRVDASAPVTLMRATAIPGETVMLTAEDEGGGGETSVPRFRLRVGAGGALMFAMRVGD